MVSKRKQVVTILFFICLWQLIYMLPGKAAIERKDQCTIGDLLGLPVCQWRDETVKTKALIVAFHGMTFYGQAFDDLARYLAAEGYPVYAFDLRGFGRWRLDSQKYPGDGKIHFTECIKDAQHIIVVLHNENPGQRIFCLGESLGSNLVLSLMSEPMQGVDGAILSGLGVKEAIHPQPRMIVDFWLALFHPNRPLNLKPYIGPYLASDPTVIKTYLNDPQIFRQLSIVELIKVSITNKRSIKHVDMIPQSIPILIMAGEKDKIYKSAALPHFVEKLGTQRTTLKILPDKGHLLLELQPVDAVVGETIDDWLSNQSAVAGKISER